MKHLNLHRFACTLTGLLLILSCQGESKGKDGNIQGIIRNANGKKLRLEKLKTSEIIPLDSVTLDESGKFSLNVDIKEPGFYRAGFSQSNFVLLFLQPGEKINLDADGINLGKSSKFPDNSENQKLADATRYMIKVSEGADSLNRAASMDPNLKNDNAKLMQMQLKFQEYQEMQSTYIRKYIEANSQSLTCIALINQLNPETDFALFKKLDEGLMKKYPESDYTKDFHANVSSMLKLSVGSEAPDIELENPEGIKTSLSSLRGKVVLIDFWASWCRPCRAENPNVVRLYNQYKDKGFEVFSVSLDKSKEEWIKAIQADGLVWKSHVSDLGFWQSAVVKLYNISGIPQTYLVDKNGIILGKSLRGEDLERKLAEVLK